jgi:hypothetical protein
VSHTVDRYVAPSPQASDAPDAFRFAELGKFQAILSNAGAAATSERVLRFMIRASVSVENFWTLRYEMSEKLRTKMARLTKHQSVELTRDVIEALRAYSSDGAVVFPAEVLIVSGGKASS